MISRILIRINWSCMAAKIFMPKWRRIPASMAEVRERGICLIAFSKSPVTPVKRVKNAAKIKAPTASDIGTPDKLVTNKAAPGVDQPVKMGMR